MCVDLVDACPHFVVEQLSHALLVAKWIGVAAIEAFPLPLVHKRSSGMPAVVFEVVPERKKAS